jgi:hypothetical protein
MIPVSVASRFFEFPDTVSAAIPVQGCNKLVATLGRKICTIDRDTGEQKVDVILYDPVNYHFRCSVGCPRHGAGR